MKIKVYIKEIQYRLFFTCSSFFFNLCVLYYYKEQIIFLLGQHQTSNFPHFIATNLPEVFFCLIKFSVYLAIYFTFPIILTQSWFFIIPALYKYEYKIIKNFIIISLIVYIIGNFSIYTILIPYCWKFFSGFELNYEKIGVGIQLETRLYEYLNFFTEIFFSLNIILNLCLFLCFFLLKFPTRILTKIRKIIYFFSFILATILTPPDILSQIFVGIVLIATYEFFLFSIFLTNEYKKRANNGTRTRNFQSHNLAL